LDRRRDQTSTWTHAEFFVLQALPVKASKNDIDVEGLEILDGAQVQICRETIVTASQTKGKAPFPPTSSKDQTRP